MTDSSGVLSGRIADRPVADLLDALHTARKTGVARFRTALGSATVWFRDGELIDADMGRFHMDAAILRLLKIRDGEFEVELKQVNRRRVIKPSTAQLLAEGRQRAPRPRQAADADAEPARPRAARAPSNPGRRAGQAPNGRTPSGPFEAPARADSQGRPRARPVDPRAEPPRRPVDPRAEPRSIPATARPVPDDDVLTVVAATPKRPLAPDDPDARTTISSAPTGPDPSGRRGPNRRKMAGWQPMAGGGGQSPPPDEPAPASEPKSKRTMFMFGVSKAPAAAPAEPDTPATRPVAPQAPAPRPVAASAPPAAAPARPAAAAPAPRRPAAPAAPTPAAGRAPTPAAPPRAASPGAAPSAPHPSVPATPAPAGAIRAAVPAEDSDKIRRRRPAPVQSTAFEPERLDRTLMRAGPIPPPPGANVSPGQARPPTGPNRTVPADSGAVPVSRPGPRRPARPSTEPTMPPPGARRVAAAMAPAPAAAPVPSAIPQEIDHEYSHPISVPNEPNIGRGGTLMLDAVPPVVAPPQDLPLPQDPQAEATVVIRADAITPDPAPVGPNKSARVGRYEVLLRLARGGMGTVYLCRVTGEGGFRRLFALKVIREHLNNNQAYVRMLLEEARVASRLSHPNVVGIIDIDTFANQHFLVMEYVEGCTFSELLKARPRSRPPELVVPIIIDSLTGLHAAHTMRGDDGSVHPLIHCDFSPQNMLVGVNGTCRITDFGVAKAADALPQGRGRGKPGYLSPEQVRGLPLTPSSDIFSAGVVLWNALTGEQLFEGDSPESIVHQVVTRKIPKPSSVGLRPPACFDRICLKALDRDPSRRYRSAEKMMMELRKAAIAEDYLAPSSEVGHWVQESFGAQIELRRQAAGLAPSHLSTALALRDMGPTGHSVDSPGDGSATGRDSNASQTMMLRGDAALHHDGDEGLGPRARVVVLIAALAFAVAALVTLIIRPDLLRGGILDENGQYVEVLPPAPLKNPPPPTDEATAGGSTGATAAAAAADTADDEPMDGSTTGGEPDSTGELVVQEPPEPVKGKSGKGKSGKGKSGKGKSGKGKSGKGKSGKGKPDDDDKGKPDDDKGKTKPDDDKGKSDDGGAPPPPPNLDDIFRPPGG